MATLKVRVRLSDTYRKARFVATGEMPAAETTVEFDTVEMTAGQRATVIEYGGTSLTLNLVAAAGITNLMPFDNIPTLDEVVAGMTRINAEIIARERANFVQWLKNGEKALRNRIAERNPAPLSSYDDLTVQQLDRADALGLDTSAWRKLLAEVETQRAAWVAEREAEKERTRKLDEELRARAEAERVAAKQRFEADKASWVAAHGSDYLKRACAGGYDCARLYVKERAAMEAPDFVVDFADRAAWKSRSCPSEAALDVADEVTALNIGEVEIVWLTKPVTDDDFEECEAVVVRKYLGRYDLIKMM